MSLQDFWALFHLDRATDPSNVPQMPPRPQRFVIVDYLGRVVSPVIANTASIPTSPSLLSRYKRLWISGTSNSSSLKLQQLCDGLNSGKLGIACTSWSMTTQLGDGYYIVDLETTHEDVGNRF